MKILYAAGNREGSYLQYKRFLQSIKHKNIELKTAGYQKSIKDLNADYTLDALLNFTKDDKGLFYNGNYNYYYKQIQSFAPDLIISDLELYTSLIALELKIQLWQVSSLLLYWAIPDEIKNQMNIWISSPYAFSFGAPSNIQKIKHILANSNKRYVVSLLCDTSYTTNLKDHFEWIRPEFELTDVVNTNVSDGSETTIADLFYNQKEYCFDHVNKNDPEAIIVSEIDKLYSHNGSMAIEINDNVKFLKELI